MTVAPSRLKGVELIHRTLGSASLAVMGEVAEPTVVTDRADAVRRAEVQRAEGQLRALSIQSARGGAVGPVAPEPCGERECSGVCTALCTMQRTSAMRMTIAAQQSPSTTATSAAPMLRCSASSVTRDAALSTAEA